MFSNLVFTRVSLSVIFSSETRASPISPIYKSRYRKEAFDQQLRLSFGSGVVSYSSTCATRTTLIVVSASCGASGCEVAAWRQTRCAV